MFPFLCDMAKEKDYKQFGAVVTGALKLLALFFVPITVGTILLRRPVVQFLYDWGKWTDVSTDLTSLALGLYVIALTFYSAEAILMQSFFSMQNTWIPVAVGLAASSLQVLGLWAAISYFHLNEFYCVALAFPLSRILKNVVLILLMKRKVLETYRKQLLKKNRFKQDSMYNFSVSSALILRCLIPLSWICQALIALQFL